MPYGLSYPPFSGFTGGTGGGGGGGAPVNASYLVLGLDGTLTDERVFTPVVGSLSATDGGPGGLYSLDLAAIVGVAGSYTYASITVDGYGRVTAVASGTAPAPANAQYLTLALDGTLANERVFSPTARFSATDGGAGGNYTLDLATIGTIVPGAYTLTNITVDAYGRITAIASGSVASAGGWTDGGTDVYLTTSTDVVAIGSNTPITNRKLSVINTGTNLGIGVTPLAATDNLLESKLAAEANARYAVDSSGTTLWGPGSGAADLGLRRVVAGVLGFDNAAAGTATFGPRTDLTCGLGNSIYRWADIIGTTHRVFSTAGGANPNASLSATALQFGAGGASALDLRMRRSAAKTLTFDDNAGAAGTFVFIGTAQTQARLVGQVTTAVTPYNATATDDVIFANPGANQVINIPTAASAAGRRITVKRINLSAFTVTVTPAGGTIDGAATNVIAAGTYNSITVVSDGANWWII